MSDGVGGGFAPTHQVPEGGLDAYAAPDAGPGPVARLDPWLSVAERQRSGDWSEVVCDNGWTCWVDARWLQPLAAAGQAAPAAAPAGAGATGRSVSSYAELYQRAHPAGRSPAGVAAGAAGTVPAGRPPVTLPLLGAALVGIGAFLPWLTFPMTPSLGTPSIPIEYLWTTDDLVDPGPIDLVVPVVAAAVVAVIGIARASWSTARRGAGWAVVVLTSIFVGQTQRLVSDIGDGGPGLIESLGFGVLVTLVGGLLLGLAPDRTVLAGTDPSGATSPPGAGP